ncbi:TerB family tellurite resistance protein [Candidatus Pelagibacter sp.]|nr:TerB family tellurite resistance protein [Candidatus Pelagibacter sp.]
MILKFFNKEEQSNKESDLINVACLMIHAAKIDENYTDKEKTIIKNTLIKLNNNDEDIDKIILEAEKKESDSNHIQDFTKNIKAMDKENKTEIIKNIWSIILSDGNSDIYEENLMRRLAGLLYVDAKTMGDIKLEIKNRQKQ